MISVWAVEHATGGIMHGLFIFVCLFIAYYMSVYVLNIDELTRFRVPALFQEFEDGINNEIDRWFQYEYRPVEIDSENTEY